jgi:transmembrane sensor
VTSSLQFDPGEGRTLQEQAASWAMRDMDRPLDARLVAAREAWLNERPEHREAYTQAIRALGIVAANMADPAVMALRRKALKASPMGPMSSEIGGRLAAGLAVCAIVIAIGVGLWISETHSQRLGGTPQTPVARVGRVYSTSVGQRLTIPLPDGSLVTLDTASAVRIRYTVGERSVDLMQGQALFKVAKHQPAPFQVYAGDQRITALGTVFDVRIELDRVRVSLLEGSVRVASVSPSDLGAPQREVVLDPGQALEQRGAIVRVANINPTRTKSWIDGVLDFDDEPLASAVAEVNRYSEHKIILEGVEIPALRISGIFTAGDTERFAQTMAELFSLQVAHDTTGQIILSRRLS